MNFRRDEKNHAYTRVPWQIWTIVSLGSIAIVAFSQSGTSYSDEGFHLLTALLVGAGKVPYRDFFYQHPPLFPYLYAGWMQIAGETWRSAHLLSALLTLGSVWLVATYLTSRYPSSRISVAVFTFLLLGLNPQFVWLGTVGHPYALCMFLSVLAFRLVIHGVWHIRTSFTFLAGFAAGGAALSSFLVAPILPVVLLWILFHEAGGRRIALFAWFFAGAVVWLVPLAWFFVQAPQPMLFELVEYHLYYRGPSYRVPPSDAFISGLRHLVAWARAWDGLVATLLALLGFWCLMFRMAYDRKHRAELSLAAALTGALALFICTPHPSFTYYFVVVTPFLCILSYHGVTVLAQARWTVGQSAFALCLCAAVLIASVLRPAYRLDEGVRGLRAVWNDHEAIVAEINRVTPPEGAVSAPEEVQFAARRLPRRGLESSYGSELDVSPGLLAALNVVPDSQVEERLRQGWFSAVWMAADDARLQSPVLGRIYDRRTVLRLDEGYGYLLWKGIPSAPQSNPP